MKVENFMPDVSPAERIRLLRENCDSHEETTYFKELTADELDVKRESFFENYAVLAQLTDDLAQIKKDFKAKAEPIKDTNKVLHQEIRTRKMAITGTLYHMAEHESGLMITYDEAGEFVSSRRLRPNEKQGRLFVADKTGTNDK